MPKGFLRALIFDTAVNTVDFVAWPEIEKPPCLEFSHLQTQERRGEFLSQCVLLALSVSPADFDTSTFFSARVVVSLEPSSSFFIN